MAVFVFLDTNNWIYLANGFNVSANDYDDLHYKIFGIIKKRVEDGSLVFLINDIVLKEFENNKIRTEEKIKRIQDKVKSYIEALKAIKKFVSDDSVNVDQLVESVKSKAEEKISIQRKHIANVEEFLKTKTKTIAISKENRIESSEMAEDKKAPFIGEKKNSMSDALILLSAIEYLQKNETTLIFDEFAFNAESYFVSSNSGDFSDPKCKEKIHPDLEPILSRSETKFYYTLHQLIKSLEEKFLTREEEVIIDEASWIPCEVCEYLFSNIEFSDPFNVYNPFLDKEITNDPKQISLFKDIEPLLNNPYTAMRTAYCDHCSAEFIECPYCEELVRVEFYNKKFSCQHCSYKFIWHQEIDRKGMIYRDEIEIIKDYNCVECGNEVDSVNEIGLCPCCLEYRNVAENS